MSRPSPERLVLPRARVALGVVALLPAISFPRSYNVSLCDTYCSRSSENLAATDSLSSRFRKWRYTAPSNGIAGAAGAGSSSDRFYKGEDPPVRPEM
jgi:hypothetical protein